MDSDLRSKGMTLLQDEQSRIFRYLEELLLLQIISYYVPAPNTGKDDYPPILYSMFIPSTIQRSSSSSLSLVSDIVLFAEHLRT